MTLHQQKVKSLVQLLQHLRHAAALDLDGFPSKKTRSLLLHLVPLSSLYPKVERTELGRTSRVRTVELPARY